MPRKRSSPWAPSEDQMKLWPGVSGNAINGVGEEAQRRPSPIYWHPPDSIPHGPLQNWFYGQTAKAGPALVEARLERQRAIDAPLKPISESETPFTPQELTQAVAAAARACGADDVGMTAMKPDYVFAGHPVPDYTWMIRIAVAHEFEAMRAAPSTRTLVEVTQQYARGTRIAKGVANWLRQQGRDAYPYGGPMAGSFLLIPAAIEAGLGELGKHGSMIHPRLGSNFRLACVLTNAPLIVDERADFGAQEFCANCRICEEACPPAAIRADKVLVRGERRWYVDFDKCLPYFNEASSCAICLAACPFSRPGVGDNLVAKLAARRSRPKR